MTETAILRRLAEPRNVVWMEPLATHEDVTTIMDLLGDIRDEARRIRELLEEDDGEEEEDPEDDA